MLKPGDTVEMHFYDKETAIQKFVRKVEFLSFGLESVLVGDQCVPYACAIVQLENGTLRAVPIESIRIID